MLTGSFVAIATPMQPGGALDLPALRKLIDFHVANGTAGIVVVGTTGESPTVSVDEHCLLIKTAIDHAARAPAVIAGTGANSTTEALALTEYAKAAGAAAACRWFPITTSRRRKGCTGISAPSPKRSICRCWCTTCPAARSPISATDTVLRLAELPGIIGIKDATSDLVRHVDLIDRLPKDKSFALLSGNDDTALAYMLLGGHGVVSVTANVRPRAMADLCAAALAGKLKEAREINARLMPLHAKLFVEANPIPVKWALAEMRMIAPDLRLPLTPLAAQYHDTVRAALKRAGCL